MSTKSKRETLADDLFVKMLETAGQTRGAATDPYWRFNYTLTRDQYSDLKKEGVDMIQKALKVNKSKAIGIFNWFYKEYGLRIKG